MFRLSLLFVLLSTALCAAGAEEYQLWEAPTQYADEVVMRYERQCPRAEAETMQRWLDRCVPEEAWWAMQTVRVINAGTLELGGEIAVIANIKAPRLLENVCEHERKIANMAVVFLKLRSHGLKIKRLKVDPQGRVAALFLDAKGHDLGELLVAEGYAAPEDMAKNVNWCK